ncbi:hypothetical protein [Yoonia sediminilitoris]|uniref:Uncharacterized protein n=1 Tax=Yoonia sediminilitoris TaxID=1286148 RepID=A0A2T6K6W1_9RHOB|nr:hypothetical protein [Yoonia sediminilitoris]PUB10426.1 hypothetical protein C8N45_11953 [Yoonia sediminilitoris]RCW89892.1 hypothetical protein DFP92_11953 [Yoonia sediminilitoris]
MEKIPETIWPLLNHPLILVGFIIFLAFSTYRALLAAGVIPPISQRAGGAVVQSLLRYVFYIAIIGMILGFGIRYYELYLDNGAGEEQESLSFSEVQVSLRGESGTSRAFLQSTLGTPEHSDPDATGFDLFGAGETLLLVDYFNEAIVGKAILGDLSEAQISHPFGLYHYPKISSLADLIDDNTSCELSLRIPNWFTGGTAGKELEFLAVGCGSDINSQGFRDWGIYTDVYSFREALDSPNGTWGELLESARCQSVNWSDPDYTHCDNENKTYSVGVSIDSAELAQLTKVAKNIPVWGFFDCSFQWFGPAFESPTGCYELDALVLNQYSYIATRLNLW